MNSAGAHKSDRIGKVLHLSSALADQILMARLEDRPVQTYEISALVKAARLLEEHGEPWPPLLTQVLCELSGAMDKGLSESSEALPEQFLEQRGTTVPEPPDDARGMRRFLGLLKKD
ncbi:hypothetical protein [Methylobacterium segetis]|uniref:hypothetical protein n=1 Tax=Methylobacterium segetis TaxID=2488750 RepID=UPI0010471CE0|nr:hypothetical protein [Methylobacterium segetis]